MMIDPETYYEENLKGKDEKQILSTIRGLKNQIGRLKNIIENPDYEHMTHICPSERVRISVTRRYLERAKQALEDVGGTYKPSKAEIKALSFQENIKNISRITFEIGGFFCGTNRYVLDVDEDKVVYNSEESNMPIEEEIMDKEEFMDELADIYIGEWRSYYDTERWGYIVKDGIQWSVTFEYNNGHKTVEFAGSNDYPYNFSSFMYLFGLDDDMEFIGPFDM